MEVRHEEPAIQQVYATLEDARRAADDAGGNLDSFGTPAAGGGWRFVEHIGEVDEK